MCIRDSSITYEADKTYNIKGVQYDGKAMIQNYWGNYQSFVPCPSFTISRACFVSRRLLRAYLLP